MYPKTLRAKLTILTMLVMGALLASIAVVVDVTASNTLLGSIDQDLRDRGREMSRMGGRRGPPPPNEQRPMDGKSSVPMIFNENEQRHYEEMQRRMKEMRQDKSLGRPRFIMLDSSSSDPMMSAMQDEPIDPAAVKAAVKGVPQMTTIKYDDAQVLVYSHPVYRDGKLVGVAQIAHSLEDANRSIQNLRRILLNVVLPFGVVFAGIGSLFVVDRLMRPLRAIRENAEAIEASNLGDRLPVIGHDEFAGLATTLNGMLDRLDRAFQYERQTSKQLQETVTLQRRFTADASHELKTPLAVIKANTGLLRLGEMDADETESVSAIDAAADRMNRLVRDLLVLARAEAGQFAHRFEPTDLVQLVRQASGQVAGADGNLDLDLPDAPLMVSASTDELTRVFVNLIDNAIRHGRGETPVRVSVFAERTHALVTVTDNGIGIAAEHLPFLFDRFYRIDDSRTSETGGTGLGLAITKGIVEAHAGTIEAESEVGRGTVFLVRVPLLTA